MTYCIWRDIPDSTDARGWRRVRCERCGRNSDITPHPHHRIFATCRAVPLNNGKPGTELKNLIAMLGATPNSNCNCNAKAAEMDRLGVEGCRRERDRLVAWLADAYHGLTWSDVLKATAGAVTSGLYLQINPLAVCESLVDIAIERTEAASKSAA